MKTYNKVLTTSMTMVVGMTVFQPLSTSMERKVEASTNYDYTVNTDILNIRDQASTNGKKIGTVKKGQKLTVSQTMTNGWLKIAYNGGAGYVSGEYVTKSVVANPTPDVTPPTTQYEYLVNTDVLNVRSTSSTSGRIIGTVKQGEKLQVNQTMSNGWLRISYNGTTGYVSGEYVKKQTISTTTPPVVQGTNYEVINSDVHLRDQASWSGKSLSIIKKGIKVKAEAYNNDWMKVSHNGMTGYVAKSYLQAMEETAPTPPTTETPPDNKEYEYVVTTTLNVRSGPSTSNEIIGTVKNGEKLDVVESTMGWYKIRYKEQIGYVSSGYVKKQEITSSPPVVIPPAEQQLTHEIVETDVHLRDQASWSGTSLAVIKKGTQVQAQSYNADWMKVTYEGNVGYVGAAYVKEIGEQVPTPPENDGEVATSYQQVDLRKLSNVRAEEINAYIDAYTTLTGRPSKITGMGQYIIDIGREYGINELFLASIIVHESMYGTSYLAHYKNNLTGLYAFDTAPYDSAARFAGVEESIRYAAQYIRASYLNENGTYNNGAFLGDHTTGMNVKYSSDPTWGKKIANHMEKMKAFDMSYYANQPISAKTITVTASVPTHSDTYPTYAVAKVVQDITLYDAKGGKKVGVLKAGNTFKPLEKTNDFYLKLATNDGQVYWTSKLPMSTYTNYFRFTNLLRVRNDQLGTVSLYAEPSTKSNVIAVVDNFSHLEVSIEESTSTFYKVKVNGKTAWIQTNLAERVYK